MDIDIRLKEIKEEQQKIEKMISNFEKEIEDSTKVTVSFLTWCSENNINQVSIGETNTKLINGIYRFKDGKWQKA